jgi:hypothetical protein
VGEILSKRVVSSEKENGGYLLFNVRVIERFRGTESTGEVVSVRTGFGGGDCGYPFKVGAKYLIDASKNDEAFLTGICSLTAPIEDSEVELRTLRRIAAGQRPPDLVGILLRGSETGSETRAPLGSVGVEAMRVADRSTQKTVTDAFGSFTFERLPDGKYELIFDLPANLSAAYTDSGIVNEGEVPSVSIESRDAESAACHVLIVTEASSSISGVVESSGKAPIEGWVNADTVTPDDKPWNTVLSVVPESNGKFLLGHLPAGRYSLAFTSRVGFVRGESQIIELKDGERRTNVILLSR